MTVLLRPGSPSASAERLGLAGLELGLVDDALVLEVGETGDLVRRAAGALPATFWMYWRWAASTACASSIECWVISLPRAIR